MNDLEQKMNDHLEIRLLGGLEIRKNGKLTQKFASRKAEAVIAYLACNPAPSSREWLATMLWEGRGQNRSMSNLRVVINSIKQQLDEFVTVTRRTIELNFSENVWIDVIELERVLADICPETETQHILAAADIARIEEVLLLYRGAFLANFNIPKAPEFETWVGREAERIQRIVTRCLEAVVEYHIQQGQNREGIEWAKMLLDFDPLYERGNVLLTILLAADDQRNAAIAHLIAYRQLLAKEMDIEPSTEFLTLYEELLQGNDLDAVARQDTDAQPGHVQSTRQLEPTLPVELTSMIGRDAEMAEILRLLNDPNCRLLTLIGPGGVGKTRLAVAMARSISDDKFRSIFEDGVCFVPLEKIDESSLIVTAIADALNIPLTEEAAALVQIKSYLRRRRFLLVLDNVEHLLDDVDVVLDILNAAPHVKLLATSREHLGFMGEHLIEVQGLDYPHATSTGMDARSGVDHPAATLHAAETPSSYAAVELFERDASAQNSSFVLDDEYEAVTAICCEVEGLPLAIQLAAASMRVFSASQILARIQQNIDFLQTAMRNLPPRHRSLRAVFESSWALLTAPDQNAFRQLSVFAGSFTPDAAEQVAGVDTQLLISLVNSSLIEQVKSGAQESTRYKIHAVLRQYAQEKLADEPDVLRSTHDRHAAFYVAFLEDHEDVGDPHAVNGLTDIAVEIENCRAAWQWIVLHDKLHWAERALPVLGGYYLLHGPYQEGSHIILAAIEELEERSRRQVDSEQYRRFLAELLAVQARLYNQQAAYDEAVEAARRTIELSDGDALIDARVRGHLAAAQGYRYLGDYAEALRHAQMALELSSDHEMRSSLADSLLALGTIRAYESQYELANVALSDALATYRELGNQQNESRTLNVLGNLYLYQGDYSAARSRYEQSLQRFQRVGDRLGEAQILNNLGALHFHVGEFQEALDYYHQALRIEQATGGMHGVSLLFSNLSLLSQHMGDFDAGLNYGQSAVSIAQELGARDNQAYALLCVGHARVGRMEWAAAQKAYTDSLKLRNELGQDKQALESRAGLVRVAVATSVDDAVLADVDEILSKMANSRLVGIVEPSRIYWSCYLALRDHDNQRAQVTLKQAYDLLQQRTQSMTSFVQRDTYISNWPARYAIVNEYLRHNGSTGG